MCALSQTTSEETDFLLYMAKTDGPAALDTGNENILNMPQRLEGQTGISCTSPHGNALRFRDQSHRGYLKLPCYTGKGKRSMESCSPGERPGGRLVAKVMCGLAVARSKPWRLPHSSKPIDRHLIQLPPLLNLPLRKRIQLIQIRHRLRIPQNLRNLDPRAHKLQNIPVVL